MPKRNRPVLVLTVDKEVRSTLDELKRDYSVNVSSYVNRVLRAHFKMGARRK